MRFPGCTRLILSVFLIGICELQILADDRGIATSYYEQADRLFKSGDSDGAERLLVRAIEFYPTYSETCFLLSRVYAGNQEKTKSAIEYAEKAVSYATWTVTDPSLAARELGRLYLQTRSLKKAEKALGGILLSRPEDPEVFFLYAKTALESNNPSLFEKTILDSLKRFPDTGSLYLLASDFYTVRRDMVKAIAILDKAIKIIPGDTSLLYEKASVTNSAQEKKELLTDYFLKGGKAPAAYALAIRITLEPQSRYILAFIGNGGLNDATFLDEIYPVVSKTKDRKKILDDALSGFSGIRIVDNDKDGKYEEKYSIVKGETVGFVKDSNQDGEPEIELSLEKGFPVRAIVLDDSGTMASCVYSEYPAVKSISYIGKIGRSYNLIPFTLDLQLVRNIGKNTLKSNVPLFRFVTDKIINLPAESVVRNISYSLDETDTDNPAFGRNMNLLGGKAVLSRRDDDKDGSIDHTIEFANGIPVSGKRDTDADGIFETHEYYTAGKLTKLTSDNDGDGVADFIQLLAADGVPYQLEWDYTYDGKMDAIELIKGNTITYKFSTRYNGVFDLAMTFTNDLLVSIVRKNASIGILPGSKPGLYWIGKKGPDNVAIDAQTPSGKISVSGKNYFVFNYKHKIYIEEI